jgi:hypothetical protein
MYKWIQSIWVIYCSLFLMANDTHSLKVTIKDVYKTGVHILIYGHVDPNSPDENIDIFL